jgi:hypothetical protein
MVTARQIEMARREYVAAIGTEQERAKRERLEALVQAAKMEQGLRS